VELSGPADEAALARVAELAGELLANPVIEEFTLHEKLTRPADRPARRVSTTT